MTSDSPESEPPAARRVSRRALLTGGVGAAVLVAAGVPLTLKLRDQGPTLVSDMLARKPFYAAHRGGSDDWPECSMEGYRQSVAAGVDALEISLARSADGVWFGLHDPTLDRTSGTKDFAAAEHSWAQISRYLINPTGPNDRGQAPQPYLRFDDLVTAYGGKKTIFVDPKAADPAHYPELMDIMNKSTGNPTECFVAKYYCTGTVWADAARAHGYKSWGFYYGADVESGATPLAATAGKWDLLGMDVEGSPAAWSAIMALGKPVIGHVIADKPSAAKALGYGASGLMVSGVLEVLGATP